MAIRDDFTAGEVLAAADLNDTFGAKANLASPTFTGTPAAPTAASGTNTTQLATTAFVQSAGGLTLITSETFSAVSALSINDCFSATYQNYLILVTLVNTIATTNQMRLRVAGSDSSASYSMRTAYLQSAYSATTETASVRFGDNGTQKFNFSVNLSDVAAAAPTCIFANGNDSAATSLFATGGVHTLSTAYDGFTMFCNSGTFTGSIRTYGYKN